MMGLTLAERRAVTETTAIRYWRASKRKRARFSMSCVPLQAGIAAMPVRRSKRRCGPRSSPRRPRPPKYGPEVIAALTVCWTVLGMPAGKRLAPMLGELVAVLRHFGELVIDEDTAALLVSMSAATIDRRLAGNEPDTTQGTCSTKPGSLLKSQIPVRTWAEWDDAVPGFVEIDLVGHEAATRLDPMLHPHGHRHRHRLDREPLSPNKAAKCVLAALNDIATGCRSRSWGWTPTTDRSSSTPTCCNGANSAISPSPGPGRATRTTVSCRAEELGGGPHRGRLPPLRHRLRTVVTQQDLAAAVQADELLLPQQKLISKVRDGAKVSKKYDKATTPFHRAIDHPTTTGAHRALTGTTP